MNIEENLLIVIPARGGSKRIPNKNIKKLCGQPMIYWPLQELSKKFSSKKILVSTDDKNIISVVERIGLKVPFVRPKNLSDDFTGTMPVASHALEWYEDNIEKIDFVLIVYPTAVMLNINDVIKAIELLKSDVTCELVMSATEFPFPIQRGVYIKKNGFAEMFYPKYYKTRSQDLISSYHDAGQFYVWKSDSLRKNKTLVNSNTKLFQINRNYVIDIDTPTDINIAETKLKLFQFDKFNKNFKFK